MNNKNEHRKMDLDQEDPSPFFKEILDSINPGYMLFHGGRIDKNANYAKSIGWKIDNINYSIDKLQHNPVPEIKYDVITIFLNSEFPESHSCDVHARLISFLKPKGLIICQKYSKLSVKIKSKTLSYFELLFDRKCSQIEFDNILIQHVEIKQLYNNRNYPKYLSLINLIGYNNK